MTQMLDENILELVKIISEIALAIGTGIVGGNAVVYAFNHFPAKWLCDYNEEPSPELLDDSRQRLNSYPWKMLFSMVYVVLAIYLFTNNLMYGIPTFMALWLLTEISIADVKYGIVPDQLVLMLAITAIGFLPFENSPRDMFLGALLSGGSMLIVAIGGKIIFSKDVLGFGDVKLLAAVGLISGVTGAALILVGTSFLSCLVYGMKIITNKIKRGDYQALAPFISIASAAFIIFRGQI